VTLPAFVDFETRSRADLKKIGGRRYAEHPSTRVVCGVYRRPLDGEWLTQEWIPGDPPPWFAPGPCVAHNAMTFDRHMWRKLGWPEPERWIDTAELARVAGYSSAKLEWLAENLLGAEKDMQGNALTRALSKPKQYYGAALAERLEESKAAWKAERAARGGKERLPTARLEASLVAELDAACEAPAPIPAETLAKVVAYCRLDVELMAALFDGFLGQWLDSDLPGLEAADRALNDRGICFDRDLARLLVDVSEAMGAQALERAGVSAEVVNSPAQLRGALAALGVSIDNAQADTLEALLKGPALLEQARLIIEARQATASIAAGKLKAGLARCSPDGRLRDNRTPYGAHTGRWAGKGMQLDNLSKGL